MCGLVGVMNKYTNGFQPSQQEIFSTLLLVDYLRGPDSTGVFSVANNGEVMLAKEASNPINFMKTKEYEAIMKKMWSQGSAIIGHNRKATRGTVNDANAHPFVVDDHIVLVHNGTMWGDHKKHADVEVDSHAIAHVLKEEADVGKALSSIDAAYALIWYDFKTSTINLVRNKERPLWWMETESSWVWSSEKAMLDFVIARHDLKVKKGPNELPEDVLQTFVLDGKSWEVDSKKLEIKKKVYGGYSQSSHQGQYYPGSHPRHPFDRDLTWDADDNLLGTDNLRDPRIMQPIIRDIRNHATYRAGDAPGTTTYAEKELARKANKVVTNVEFHHDVIPNYPKGKDIVVKAFDYSLANQKDDRGGFYLYLEVTDDPDVIVRIWFDSKVMSEERIMQMAGTEYVYRVSVDTKRWAAFNPGIATDRTPGYTIISADKATLLWGGGIGDKSFSQHKEIIQ